MLIFINFLVKTNFLLIYNDHTWQKGPNKPEHVSSLSILL